MSYLKSWPGTCAQCGERGGWGGDVAQNTVLGTRREAGEHSCEQGRTVWLRTIGEQLYLLRESLAFFASSHACSAVCVLFEAGVWRFGKSSRRAREQVSRLSVCLSYQRAVVVIV